MDPNDCLNVLEAQPKLHRLYTQVCFCFSVAEASSHLKITTTLRNGLEQLSASFPWVAGQVVNEGASEGISGTFKIVPLEKTPRLIVKDYTQDPSMPTKEELRRAGFPMRMLNESIVAPRKTLPIFDEHPVPVFLLQANFVVGGLLLTMMSAHNVMDGTGQGQIMHLLSKACRGEQFSSEELSSGNLTRRNLIPLLDSSYKPGPELDYQIIKKPLPHQSTAAVTARPPSKGIWAYFSISGQSLADLKSLALQSLRSGWISSDDALTAFVWQSIQRARLPWIDPMARVTLARSVDTRHLLDVPATYPGLCHNMTYHTWKVRDLVDAPLGTIASEFRTSLDPTTLMHNTKSLATFLDRTLDKSIVSFTATLVPEQDSMLASWAGLDCYDLAFGLGLGKPEAVRRPRSPPKEHLVYFMPKSLEGEIAVCMCLRHDDLERLKADEVFMRYARFIG